MMEMTIDTGMSREEKQKAIDALKISAPVPAMTQEEFKDYIQTLNKIMDWLEQEPTTKNDLAVDAVSRQAINGYIDYILSHGMGKKKSFDFIKKFVAKLPSITPQEPRKGHWIETAEEYYKAINEKGGGVNENTDYFTDDIACSECLAKFSTIDNETERFKCCPHCGADMREVEE